MKESLTYQRALAVVGAFAMAAVLLVSSPAAASPDGQDWTEQVVTERDRSPAARTTDAAAIERPAFTLVPCLQFTDSIVRLYSAYFLRAPDEGGFNFWRTEYEAGRWSLPAMSTFFSQSDEFVGLYGSLTDAEFIDLIYQNIFGRPADDGGRDFWLGRMADEGLDRGTVMLNFSESPEYVEQSDTLRPVAGYFNWYPEGTQFSCTFDTGFTYEVFVQPSYVDTLFVNVDSVPIELTIELFTNGAWVEAQTSTLEPDRRLLRFAQPFVDGSTTMLRVTATGQMSISIAHSAELLPPTRAGWL